MPSKGEGGEMSDELEPLWTDEEINERAQRWESLAIGQANMPMADYIEAAMLEVKARYEADRRAPVANNAASAGVWEPVPDMEYKSPSGRSLEVNNHILMIEYGIEVILPDNIRLCRLVADAPQVPLTIPDEVREAIEILLHYMVDRADDMWVRYDDEEMHALDAGARMSAMEVRSWLAEQRPQQEGEGG